MIKIFFSYTLRDKNIDRAFLSSLRNWIINQGYDCYIDLLDNNYNNKGFQKQLVSILKTCDIFFRIDSPEYLNSKWTKKELKEAETNELQIVTMASDHLKIMMLNNESIEQYLKMNQ